jgi:DNA polymerase IV
MPHIVHVGIDVFFASVEQVQNPALRGTPVLVGCGAVASASHEAMLCGVETGMSLTDSLHLCPQAVVVPGHYERYAEFAERVRSILEKYTPKVEAGVLDDFYLDFRDIECRDSGYEAMLRSLQAEILGQTGLTVSIGAASTRIVAAVASQQRAQPGGLRIIPPGTEETLLAPLSLDKLPGIGRAQVNALAKRGVTTVGQLRLIPKPVLVAAFGDVIGRQIWESAHGRDQRRSLPPSAPISITCETTIAHGTVDAELLGHLLAYLSRRVSGAVRESGKQAATVGVRLRYMDDYCAQQTKRLTCTSNNERELLLAAKELFAQLLTRGVPIRQMGISITNVNEDLRRGELVGGHHNRRFYPNRELALSRPCLSN